MEQIEEEAHRILSLLRDIDHGWADAADPAEEAIDKFLDDVDNVVASAERRGASDRDVHAAMGAVVQAASVVNAAAAKGGRLLARLQGWVSRLLGQLKKIAKKSGADSFSLTASAPLGISVTVNWPV